VDRRDAVAREPALERRPVDGAVRVYDIMGAPRATPATRDGRVRAIASLDPLYLVTDGGRRLRARPPANDERRTRTRRLSAAEHIVLDQRFPAAVTHEDRCVGPIMSTEPATRGRGSPITMRSPSRPGVPRRA
jgi:hypothetical protein